MNGAVSVVGCAILRREVELLVGKNGWTVHPRWLKSELHSRFEPLGRALDEALSEEGGTGSPAVVLYGCCHPRMDTILSTHRADRVGAQNCIAMLLGHERFMEELERGTYFLLEGWARTWDAAITADFGTNAEVIRQIFHDSHSRMVAVRTPCSADFTEEAEAAARFVDLPLEWIDADLGHLERLLGDALAERSQADAG